MIKFQQGFAATGVYEEGYSADLVNVLLIGSALLVALGGCWAVAATAEAKAVAAEGSKATAAAASH